MICIDQRIKFNFTRAVGLSEAAREVWTMTESVLGRHHYRKWRRCQSEGRWHALAKTVILPAPQQPARFRNIQAGGASPQPHVSQYS